MLKTVLYAALLFLPPLRAAAQELFPMTEPASNVPKGALGTRFFTESYNEAGMLRNLFALRLMYGLTGRLTIEAAPNVSNHHNPQLPPEFPTHNTPQIGVSHPYLFNGADFYAKYRALSFDGPNSHFRVAIYGEYAALKVAHDEGEPTLLDDNSGVGGGIIATCLQKHFAASFTSGIILPFVYKGNVPDPIASLPSVPATVTYGKGYNYSLSLGYLLWPEAYTSYRQTSWSVYMEFLGKTYNAVQMQVGNVYYNLPQYAISTSGNKALQAGSYIEYYPGIQCIIHSGLRVDASVGLPLINRSYAHFYPVYQLGVQQYFYLYKHKKHQR